MPERAALYLAFVAPAVAGALLALGVELVPRARQPIAERLFVCSALALAVALDLRTEGPAHGVFAFVLLFLPGVLSFVIARFFLARRSTHISPSV